MAGGPTALRQSWIWWSAGGIRCRDASFLQGMRAVPWWIPSVAGQQSAHNPMWPRLPLAIRQRIPSQFT